MIKEVQLEWKYSELTFLLRAPQNPEGYPISLKFFCPVCGLCWASVKRIGGERWHPFKRACPEHGWGSLQHWMVKEYPLPPELMQREIKIAMAIGPERYERLCYMEGIK